MYFYEKPHLIEECRFSLEDLWVIAGPAHRKLKRASYGISFTCIDAAETIVREFDDLVEQFNLECTANPGRFPLGLVFSIWPMFLELSDD